MTDENVIQVMIVLQKSSDKTGSEMPVVSLSILNLSVPAVFTRFFVFSCGLANTLGC